MKKSEVQIGKVYLGKVNGKVARIRLDGIRELPPLRSPYSLREPRTETRYDITNLDSGRKTIFRSTAKILRPE